MSSHADGPIASYLEIAGRRVAVKAVAIRSIKEPRLRFDRTAIGVVRRLQTNLAEAVPAGKTLVVTITAPIRQDSATSALLEEKIRKVLATRRSRLEVTIHGNRIRARVLKGGGRGTPRLIGFVHNPEPGPAGLFDVARALLARMVAEKQPSGNECWLVVVNQQGIAPVETLRQVCLALRAQTVFKRILLAQTL